MTDAFNRRKFLKYALTLSATGVAAGVSACAPHPATPTRMPAPAATDTAAPPTMTALPAAQPTATAVPASPTAAPTAASTAAPTNTAVPTAVPTATTAARPDLAVARGASADPGELTRRAIAAIGGIERFLKKGADVIVKPNICASYHGPEYAATTNPDVVAAIVALCLGAGAKRVRVMDYPFGGTAQECYRVSGIATAVEAAGGQMEVMKSLRFRDVEIPQGKKLKQWQIYGDILDADLVINVPIAKDHGAATLTLGMKNLMGVVENRNGMHSRGLAQSIADINTVVRPQLTIIDAIRILVANGPTGGNLNDVKKMNTIIASADVVAADAYATAFFNLKPADIESIRYGNEMGLGKMDLKAIKVEEIAA